MYDIIAVGDVHEGINFGYKIDPSTGVSERAMDIHRNFAETANFAINHDSKLFVVLGDLFDRPHVSPVFRELVRKDVIEPLGKTGIEVWIMAGNHDQPRSMARGTSLDDFRAYDHVTVFRVPQVEKRTINGNDIGFLIAPYMHPDQLIARLEERGHEVKREDMFHTSQILWKEWLANSAKELDADFKLLFGHYHVVGSQLSAFNKTQYLPSEFSFTKDMIPDEVDLTVLGHIHLHQAVNDKIVYTGSVERIDWGEFDEEKGFLSIDTSSRKWTFEKLKTRDMLKTTIDLSASVKLTDDIIAQFPEEPKDKMLRLCLKGLEGFRAKVDESKLERLLADAFFYEIRWEELEVEKGGFVEFTIDPNLLFQRFVELNYNEHPSREKLLEYGRNALNEVLG